MKQNFFYGTYWVAPIPLTFPLKQINLTLCLKFDRKNESKVYKSQSGSQTIDDFYHNCSGPLRVFFEAL